MYFIVTKNQELLDLVDELTNGKTPWIAIDTEFDRRNTYYPILSLLQIATAHKVWVIDALADIDIKILAKLFENEKILKIFHAGEQDWHIIKKNCEASAYPIIDIQLMAAFASYGVSLSLGKLAAQFIYKNIDKTSQDSNWLERPLTDQQLEYAALDAKYIAEIYPILRQKLEELERLEWIVEEMEVIFKKYSDDDDTKNWTKYCNNNAKWPTPLYAYYLIKWRNALAQKLNKPKQGIISNGALKNLIDYQKASKYKADQCPEGYYEDFLDTWRLIKKNIKNKEERASIKKILIDASKEVPRNARLKAKIVNLAIDKLASEFSLPKTLIISREDLIHALETNGESLNSWRKDLLIPIFKQAHEQELLQAIEAEKLESETPT